MQTAVAYDFKGGLLAAERQLGVDYTQTLDWSALSELEDVSDLEVAAASMLETEVFRTESTFDALGRPTTQTTPDGTVVRLAYNEAALLEGVSANVRGDASETSFVSNIDYDAKGRRTLIAYGNGTETSYAYDDITQRLTRLRTTDATRTFQDLAYTYDAVGNIVEIADAAQDDVYFNGAVVTATQRYEYDALYRLTHAEGREHAGQNAAQPAEFGASPSLHPQDGTAMRTYAEQYVYDVVGNILSMQHTAASGNWTRRYQYATNGNRLQANSAPGDAVGVYSHAYTYDAHGNMTVMPHLSAVTWNYADQMRSADLGGGGTAYFVYDGAGQRVRKVRVNLSGTQTYERIYLGAYELYRERSSGALQLERETLHIADDGGRMCDLETRTVESGTPVATPTTHHRYQYSNHLGSASLELTASAEVISYEEYHPYGTSAYRAVNSNIDVSERTYRYTGKERDEETGLGYHGARYYACWLARWTASDPIGIGDGVNRYAYVSGRPVSTNDPSGTAGEELEPGFYAPVMPTTGRGSGGRGPTTLATDAEEDINFTSPGQEPANDLLAVPGGGPKDFVAKGRRNKRQADAAIDAIVQSRARSSQVVGAGIQMVGGAAEVGVGMVGAVAPEPVTTAGGVALIGLGVDQFLAGWATLTTGSPQETVVHEGTRRTLEGAGVSRESASTAASVLEFGAHTAAGYVAGGGKVGIPERSSQGKLNKALAEQTADVIPIGSGKGQAPTSGQGKLHLYSPETMGNRVGHASVEISGANGTVHTDLGFLEDGSALVTDYDGPPPDHSLEFELPDADSGQLYQRSVREADIGEYDILTNSCFTHGCRALKEAGADLSSIPFEGLPTTKAEGIKAYRWWRDFFRDKK